MDKYIENRVLKEVDLILKTKLTIRKVAEIFNVSKSTVHKDLNERSSNIDKNKYEQVKEIFKEHIEVRHLKGGESTRKRYLKLKEG